MKIDFQTIILDFDSTILNGELLEMLAEMALADDPDKEHKVRRISEITASGMEGRISFSQSLTQRLALISISEHTIKKCIQKTLGLVNNDYLNNFDVFSGKKLYIVSGGYKNIIDALSEKIFVPKSNIFANEFIIKNEKVIGLVSDNPLTQSNGKAIVAQQIDSKGKKLMIGDGMTDYYVKENGGADFFAAYTGIVTREKVVQKADFVLKSFGDLREIID